MAPPRRSLARRARFSIVTAACSVVLLSEAAVAVPLTPVLDRPNVSEEQPAASPGYLVWTQFRASGLDTFVKPAGEPRIQMNRPNTDSIGAGIDGTTAIFDVFRRHQDANLRMFDVLTQTSSAPPADVNTLNNEYQPAISGDWLFFTRDTMPVDGRRRARAHVVLFNTSTTEERVVANLRARNHYLISNQVSGDWATFESCDVRRGEFSNCQVFLYEISTEALTQIPNPNKQQYSSAVTSDGTVYFGRSANADHWLCGRKVKIIRLPNGGTEQVIGTMRGGRDVFSSFALEETGGSVTLLLGRTNCRRDFSSGIYQIAPLKP